MLSQALRHFLRNLVEMKKDVGAPASLTPDPGSNQAFNGYLALAKRMFPTNEGIEALVPLSRDSLIGDLEIHVQALQIHMQSEMPE